MAIVAGRSTKPLGSSESHRAEENDVEGADVLRLFHIRTDHNSGDSYGRTSLKTSGRRSGRRYRLGCDNLNCWGRYLGLSVLSRECDHWTKWRGRPSWQQVQALWKRVLANAAT